MPNQFVKEERVFFEKVLEEFEYAKDLALAVDQLNVDDMSLERSNDTIWRPVPMIAISQDRVLGVNVTNQSVNQLAVPAVVDKQKSVAWSINAKEGRDSVINDRFAKAAANRLMSDVNIAVADRAIQYGSLFVSIATPAGTYDDIAKAETLMNDIGIEAMDRHLWLSSADYNGMAGNLAARQMDASKVRNAYERSLLDAPVANFNVHKLAIAKPLLGQTLTTVTMNTTGSQVRFAPQAKTTTEVGKVNQDNRTQVITVSSTTGIRAGDRFTVAGLKLWNIANNVAQLSDKTFTVISVESGTQLKITPPMIGANSSPTDIERQYQNVYVESTSATAALTFLNKKTAYFNPFWHRSAIEIIPADYAVPTDAGIGVLKSQTADGKFSLVMTKQFSGGTFTGNYTLDINFGVNVLNPEMCGGMVWGQA